MRDYRIHVLVKVGDETRDVMFPSTKCVTKIDNGQLKIERENTFGEFIPAGIFNMNEIIGYYDDLRTSN